MRYRCLQGHEIAIDGDGTWVTFHVRTDADGKTLVRDYNYCMHCFGAWAERQFPLTQVEEAKPQGTILDAG